MRRSTTLQGMPALFAMAIAVALAGCEGTGDVAPEEAMESTDASPAEDDEGPVQEGSGGAEVDPEDGTTGTADPPDSTGGAESTDDGAEPADESSSGDESSTGEPEAPTVPCHEDAHEDNDVLGFPASFHGESVDAMSCAADEDWFQLLQPHVEVVQLQQTMGSSPSGEPFATLVLETHCGMKLCGHAEVAHGFAEADFVACECPEGERKFARVIAGIPGNPQGGTGYVLKVVDPK